MPHAPALHPGAVVVAHLHHHEGDGRWLDFDLMLCPRCGQVWPATEDAPAFCAVAVSREAA